MSQRSASAGVGATTVNSRCGKGPRQPGQQHRAARARQAAEAELLRPRLGSRSRGRRRSGVRSKASSSRVKLMRDRRSPLASADLGEPEHQRQPQQRAAQVARPAPGEGRRRRRLARAHHPCAAPERPSPGASLAPGQHRLPRIGIGASAPDGVAAGEEEVDAGVGRAERRPALDRPALLALPPSVTRSGSSTGIARRCRPASATCPRASRLSSASMKGTNAAESGRAVHAGSSRLPISTTIAAPHQPGLAARRRDDARRRAAAERHEP